MKYPFIPKSTLHLVPGQYWPIQLSTGNYACGVVLAKLVRNDKVESRVFFAALLDWSSDNLPREESIRLCNHLEKGALHVKAISKANSQILGQANFKNMPHNPSEYLDDVHTFGYSFLNKLAEKHFGE